MSRFSGRRGESLWGSGDITGKDKIMDREKLNRFFGNAISNLENHFEADHAPKRFTCQTARSMLSIYDLCMEIEPDHVVEVGTNHGGSTLAIIMALRDLHRTLGNITSIDLTHKTWMDVPQIHANIVKGMGIDFSLVKTISGDFSKIEPSRSVIPAGKTSVFYDMHDHEGPWSQILLDNWVPLIEDGFVAIHDFSKVPDGYTPKQDDRPRSAAKYTYTSQTYSGFAEVKRVIEWANDNQVLLHDLVGGVWFKVRNGVSIKWDKNVN